MRDLSKYGLDKSDSYLKLTIHDNDFRNELENVSNSLCEIFYFLDVTPDTISDKLPQLKTFVQGLLYEIHLIHVLFDKCKELAHKDYFEPDLEIVNYSDIPDWDNGESAFIPLGEGDVIYR